MNLRALHWQALPLAFTSPAISVLEVTVEMIPRQDFDRPAGWVWQDSRFGWVIPGALAG
jgi:hypothetical protein